MSAIGELKRRNVFRIATAYLVVSWVLVQLTNVAAPALRLPEWSEAFVFFLLAACFPVALIAAWAFEMTPEGLRRTQSNEERDGRSVRFGDYVMIGAIIFICLALVYTAFFSGGSQSRGEFEGESSVAVLPFENLSQESEQALLSQALAADIRSALSAHPGLQVASRTSSIQFVEGASLTDIGDKLSVAAIVEGSVQLIGDDLKVRAQLLDVERGIPLWSFSQDLKVRGTLMEAQAVASDEVTARVIETLVQPDSRPSGRVTSGRRRVSAPLTRFVVEAQSGLRSGNEAVILEAIDTLERVITVDPEYAEAYASIAEGHLQLALGGGYVSSSPLSGAISTAHPYLNMAKKLAPDEPYVQAVSGLLDLARGKPVQALEAYGQSLAIDPGFAKAHLWSFHAHRDLGNYVEAHESLEKAFDADPDNLAIGLSMVQLFTGQNRFREADELLDHLAELHPDNQGIALSRAQVLSQSWRPDDAVNRLREVFPQASMPHGAQALLSISLLDIGASSSDHSLPGDFAIYALLSEGRKDAALVAARKAYGESPEDLPVLFALADAEAANGHHDQVRLLLEPFIPAAMTGEEHDAPHERGALFDRPVSLLPAVTLAGSLAAQGQSERAQILLKESRSVLAMQRDLGLRSANLDYLEARLAVLEGNNEAAMTSLRRAIIRRFPGVSAVTWDPVLDELRSDPSFVAMIADLRADQLQKRARLKDQQTATLN